MREGKTSGDQVGLGGAYRQGTQHARCATCEAEATRYCPRCHKPLCSRHAPSIDEPCVDCQLAFNQRTGAIRELKNGVSLLMTLGGTIGAMLVGPSAALLAGAGIALTQGVGLGVEAIARRFFVRRRHDDVLASEHEAHINSQGGRKDSAPRRGLPQRLTRKPSSFGQYRRHH